MRSLVVTKDSKKGNIIFGIWLGIFIWISAMLVLPFITDDVTNSRSSLDCENSSISAGNKLSCLNTDITTPYFIIFAVSISLGLIIGGTR